MRENLPTIEQMECFIIYGRAGNFARAAREANITQSAFSAQIKHWLKRRSRRSPRCCSRR